MGSELATMARSEGQESFRPDRGRKKSGRARILHIAQRALPLSPSVIMLLVFMAAPIVWSVYSSFTNTALTGPNAKDPQWIGFDNYTRLFSDPVFPKSLLLTLVFVLASAVVGQNTLGMMLALLMRTGNKMVASVTGAVVVTAWVLPEIVAAFAMYAFFVNDGTLNQVLGLIGITGQNWLYALPMFSIIMANIWRGTAFSMMVYSAALDDVAEEITEASQIDGANRRQQLIFITLPIIKNTISTNLMLITLQTLSTFTLIFVMTAGGPSNGSMTLPVLAYEQAFGFFDIGYGSAIATVMVVVGALFAVVYVRLLRPEKS